MNLNTIQLRNVLLCINNTYTFDSLLSRGLTYGQIASIIIQAENEGFLELGERNYIITEKGLSIIRETKPYEEKTIRKKYLRDDKISLDDIFVPNYNGGN